MIYKITNGPKMFLEISHTILKEVKGILSNIIRSPPPLLQPTNNRGKIFFDFLANEIVGQLYVIETNVCTKFSENR